MAPFHVTAVGPYRYIYQTTSFWNKDLKKPRNIKKTIGKVDNTNNKIIFKPDFMQSYKNKTIRLFGQDIDIHNPILPSNGVNKEPFIGNKVNTIEQKNIPLSVISHEILPINLNTIEDVHQFLSNYSKYGLKYFFNKITDKINLRNILKSSLPKIYDDILQLTYYIVTEHAAMAYCNDWLEDNGFKTGYSFTSQGISKLFDVINKTNIFKFNSSWIKQARENEFLAVDITSVSSWSNTINDAEYGYNRDKKKLKKVNICTLFGQKSFLPMYQTEFSGSVNDVKTLKTIITEFYILIGDCKFTLVMDKGFYSITNIEFMLSKKDIKFIIGVPLTNNYAKNIVLDFSKENQKFRNHLKNINSTEKIYGKRYLIKHKDGCLSINNDINLKNDDSSDLLYAYVFFNAQNEIKDRSLFVEQIDAAKEYILKTSKFGKYTEIADKFFRIIKSGNKIIDVEILEDLVEEHTQYYGYFCLLTNFNANMSEIYNLYRKRNVVEQAFKNYKQYLGLDRFHVHGDKRMINKSFVLFISLIIYSYIYKIMLQNNLFKPNMTVKKLLIEFSKIKSFSFMDKIYIRPLTSTQKKLFKVFDIEEPDTL